ncbi:MAG: acyl-CoA dehydrogenase family protein [Acidimicrobiales bacterium]|jgi:alkylation response protein AidB-like acyl-CoA dehydrogenase|nr:acyl-CoA dehydrogenase family protein [Acidimicrobiales bacterium]
MSAGTLEFAWSPELVALQAEAHEVADAAIAAHGQHDDAWINGYSRVFSRELGRRGWIGMTWPTEVGGGGRSVLERFVVTEALIDKGAPIAASWFADRQMGPTLIAYGTPEQQRDFLPGILAGETGWCIGMSEPDAGSDLASLATRAVRDGDHYVVDGQKIWTSFGETADYCYLICRTSSEGPRHAGISELIVPMDTPGVTVRPIEDMTTNRHFCEVFFDGVRVPAANLVGEEGGSFRQTMRQLEHERGGVDRLLSNRALYLEALGRADTADPLVRQEVARLETGYRIGRLLVLREVLGQAPRQFSAATKAFCTEHEQRVADFVARTWGMDATLWGRAARGACYAPAYTIMGGTSLILRNILGERTLGLPREPVVTR